MKVCSAQPADADEQARSALVPAQHGGQAQVGGAHEGPAPAGSRGSKVHRGTRGRQLIGSAFSEPGSQAAAWGQPRLHAPLRPLTHEDSASHLHGGTPAARSCAPGEEARTEQPRSDAAAVSACAEDPAGHSGRLHAAKRARVAAAPEADACECGEAAALLAGGSGHPPGNAPDVVWYRRPQVLLTLAGYGCIPSPRASHACLLRCLAPPC